jgi:hypothetical protein
MHRGDDEDTLGCPVVYKGQDILMKRTKKERQKPESPKDSIDQRLVFTPFLSMPKK